MLEIYKCKHCGNIVEVLTSGGGTLVCCGEPMQKLTANTTEASQEKHIPVLEKTAGGTLVKVGSAAHPMEDKHYIEWIAVRTTDGKLGRKFLKPGGKPEAVYDIQADKIAELYAYCNIHGLWSAKIG